MKKTFLKYNIFIFIVFLSIVFSFQTFAHSGKTDSQGGHHDRVNGGYHYHHGHPAHNHNNGECPYLTENESDDSTNTKKPSIFSLLVLSVFVGWLGGALLLALLFFPLSIFFKNFFEEHLETIQLICSILVGIVTFICTYFFY
jgi:hypothetical protein